MVTLITVTEEKKEVHLTGYGEPSEITWMLGAHHHDFQVNTLYINVILDNFKIFYSHSRVCY